MTSRMPVSHSYMEFKRQSPWAMPVRCCALIIVMAAAQCGWAAEAAEAAQPLTLTGWDHDVVFEAGSTSSISRFMDGPSMLTWAETGNCAGAAVTHGLPSDRTLISRAYSDAAKISPTKTKFALQPYDKKNAVYFWPGGPAAPDQTLTLTTPAKYKKLCILNASGGFHQWMQFITVTLKFTDHADVTLRFGPDIGYPIGKTFRGLEWCLDAASHYAAFDHKLARVRTNSGTKIANAADPLMVRDEMAMLYEAQILLTPYTSKENGSVPQLEHLENCTLSGITFSKPPGEMNHVIFAVSGVPTPSRP